MLRRCLFIGILIIFLISTTVQADTLQEKLKGYQNQMDSLNDTLANQKQQESTGLKQALSLESSIDVLQNAKQQNQTAINLHQKSVAKLKSEQLALENKRQEDIRILGDYVRTEYENGSDFYLEWLFGATSLNDFMKRIEYTELLVNAFNNLQDEIASETNTIQSKQQAEQMEIEQLTQSVQSQQQVENSLNNTLAKQKSAISQLSAAERKTLNAKSQVQDDISYTQALIKQQELEAELAAKNKQQQSEQEAADKSMEKITSPVQVSATTSQLLSYAESFLGTPYVFGGTTPSGFDCSGYVQYVFAHFGVSLYRVTWNQYEEGQSVSAGDLKPGDLVFFSTYASGPSHVGIYVGNRIMINSSNNGVSYDNIDNSYWAARYIGARRVMR